MKDLLPRDDYDEIILALQSAEFYLDRGDLDKAIEEVGLARALVQKNDKRDDGAVGSPPWL